MKMKKVVLIMTMTMVAMLTCGVVPALPALGIEYFDTTDKIGHSDEVFTFGGGDDSADVNDDNGDDSADASNDNSDDSADVNDDNGDDSAEDDTDSNANKIETFETSGKLGHAEGHTFNRVVPETPEQPENPEQPVNPEQPEATPSEPEEATPSEATPSNSSGGSGGGSRSSGGSSNHGNKSSSSDDTNVIKQESDTDDKVRVMQTVEHNDDQALPITGDGNVGVWGIVSLISGFGALFLECKKG